QVPTSPFGASFTTTASDRAGDLAVGFNDGLGSCAVHVALSVRGAGFGPPTTFTDACAEPGWQVNPPLVAVSPSGAMIAAWEEISDAGVSRTRVAQRQPDGAWLPTRLLDSGGFPVALPAAVTVGQRGDALVAMYRQSARGRAYRARFVALTAT